MNVLGKSSILIEIIPIIIVYLIVIFLGHLCLTKLMKKLNYDENPFYQLNQINVIDIHKKEIFSQKQSGLLGIVERALYLIAFQFGWLAFIGLWLSFKTVVKWSRWNEKDGRIFFNNFLIGNGFNLVYAFSGFQAIHYVKFLYLSKIHHHSNLCLQLIIIWLIFLLLPYLLTFLINCFCFRKLK